MSRIESKLAPQLSTTVFQGISVMLFRNLRREYQLYPNRSLMFKDNLQTKRNVLLSNNVCQPIMLLITKWIPELTSCYALRLSQGRLGRALRTSVCGVGFQRDFTYKIDFFFRSRGSHIGSECIAW